MATQGEGRDRDAAVHDTGDMRALPAEEVRAALKRLLSAPALARAPKISRLLVYLVDAHLDGPPDALSEPVIADAVFDQPDDFNPRSNPIVRVNASRLRNVLRKHFAGEGADEPVQILLADIGYTLDIRRKDPPQAPETARPQALPPAAPAASTPPARQPAPQASAASTPASASPFGRLRQTLGAPVSLGVVIALLVAVSLLNIAYTHLVHVPLPSPDAPTPVASAAPLRN